MLENVVVEWVVSELHKQQTMTRMQDMIATGTLRSRMEIAGTCTLEVLSFVLVMLSTMLYTNHQ